MVRARASQGRDSIAPNALPRRQATPGLVPVCRPWAPSAEAVAPYLERIDATRWYSNFGPLVCEFEERLAQRFTDRASVVTTANGTLALAIALRARAPRNGLCIMPAWTFVASAHAAELAGLAPCFADVDEEGGVLTPDLARRAMRKLAEPVAAVMPVAPHGQPIDLAAWAEFEEETGTPVIVDAAAGFDAVSEAPVTVAVSLHATKALGIGEGGFIATRNESAAIQMRALSGFGFAGGARDALSPAFNAKLSEYAAAVGLAALDDWPRTRARYIRAARLMRAALASSRSVALQAGWGASWVSAACVVRTSEGTDRLERRLAAAGIETRRWWERGAHRQPAFRNAPRADDLAVTDRLAATTVGLPFAVDLDADAINRIAAAIGS
ncbi:MAG: DegT/DnrJ/EryC1/StrS family aminotransferase [Hyphomonadaceae bacterium]|nr:DegT/DnrJ/EryC1/StrS family aminotransferase [Hyphomonadaceae bacterium]